MAPLALPNHPLIQPVGGCLLVKENETAAKLGKRLVQGNPMGSCQSHKSLSSNFVLLWCTMHAPIKGGRLSQDCEGPLTPARAIS
jgi:hypothetical protein